MIPRRRCDPSLSLIALVVGLAGCPHDDGEGTSTSATESSASSSDSGGEPSASSPMSSATETDGPVEDTSTSATGLDTEPSTTGDTDTSSSSTGGDPTSGGATTGSTSMNVTTDDGTTSDVAECGDGFVDAGEECDDGDLNNDGGYGGCALDCTLQPHCGDGKHQPEFGEPCDPSDKDLVEASVCSDVCTWSGVIAFVSSKTYTGNLGGIDGADEICVTLADAAGLINPGGYRAWLSVGTNAPSKRIPKVDDAYYRLDGKKIADNSGALFGGKLQNPLNVTELKKVVSTSKVWTNTTPAGVAASEVDDCQSFSSMGFADSATVGRTDVTGSGWTQQVLMASCIDTWRLYCFSEEF